MKGLFSILLILVCSSLSYGQNITTIAGNGDFGFGGDYGPATAAILKHPRDVTVDDSGNVYIADTENGCVRRVDKYGIITTYAGIGENGGFTGDNGPATMATMSLCHGIGMDTKGNLYIADYNNQRIRKVNAAGIITTIAGNGTAGYAGDNGPATAATLNYPYDVAADKWGNVYITDGLNNSIRKVDTFGIISTVAGNGVAGNFGDGGAASSALVYAPVNIAVDTFGNIYFTSDNVVRKIDIISGLISTVAGNHVPDYSGDSGPATNAQIASNGIVVDFSGNIYLADFDNNCIRKVNNLGIISTIGGHQPLGAGFSGDGGIATNAKMYFPAGVTIDKLGNIYVADLGNNRIRKIYEHTAKINAVYSKDNCISIAPNPNTGEFHITINSDIVEKVQLVVTDILGRRIADHNIVTNNPHLIKLDVPDGFYILSITDHSYQEKVIIKH